MGYIGSHTVVQLLDLGQDVVIWDNLSNASEKVLERIEQITGKHPVFVRGDICNRDDLDKVFTEHQIEAVIHFAGLKAVGESTQIPLEYYDNNVNGVNSNSNKCNNNNNNNKNGDDNIKNTTNYNYNDIVSNNKKKMLRDAKKKYAPYNKSVKNLEHLKLSLL